VSSHDVRIVCPQLYCGIVLLYWHGQCTLWINISSYEQCVLSRVFKARECVYVCIHWLNLNMGHPVAIWNHKCNVYSVVNHTTGCSWTCILATSSTELKIVARIHAQGACCLWLVIELKQIHLWLLLFHIPVIIPPLLLVVCSTDTK
jgi:hypothetical protein